MPDDQDFAAPSHKDSWWFAKGNGQIYHWENAVDDLTKQRREEGCYISAQIAFYALQKAGIVLRLAKEHVTVELVTDEKRIQEACEAASLDGQAAGLRPRSRQATCPTCGQPQRKPTDHRSEAHAGGTRSTGRARRASKGKTSRKTPRKRV